MSFNYIIMLNEKRDKYKYLISETLLKCVYLNLIFIFFNLHNMMIWIKK